MVLPTPPKIVCMVQPYTNTADNSVSFFETVVMLPGRSVHGQAVPSAPIYSSTVLS
jgi:hypothetical protein